MGRQLTRRQFLSRAAAGSAAVIAGGRWAGALLGQGVEPSAPTPPAPKDRSVVIRANSPRMMDLYGRVDRSVMFEAIDQLLMNITGKFRLPDVVAQYAQPSDRVGLLVNRAWGLGTTPELVELIYLWITNGGVPRENVQVWDGRTQNYTEDGFAREFVAGSTVIFNLASLYAHWQLGMVGALANTLGLVADPEPYYQSHGQGIGKLWANPTFRQKHKLVIMDALRPYFGSEASYQPERRWLEQTILVSTDPVAVDAIARQMLLERRRLYHGGDWPLEPPADYVEEADTLYHVGCSRPADITVRDIWVRETTPPESAAPSTTR
jgi:hypothetical protein